MRRLRGQVAAIDLEVVALKRESANAVQTIDQIQRKVERLPQREQEIIALSRDYDNIKKSYEELLKKKLESQVSQKLEEKQKGEQFQVLEPANLPTRPFKPDRPMVLGLALLASLVVGVGGAFGLEMLDPTLRGSKEFKNFFDMPILACLPVIQDDRLKRRIAVRRAAVVGGLVSILGAYLVFLVVNGGKVKSILQSIEAIHRRWTMKIFSLPIRQAGYGVPIGATRHFEHAEHRPLLLRTVKGTSGQGRIQDGYPEPPGPRREQRGRRRGENVDGHPIWPPIWHRPAGRRSS